MVCAYVYVCVCVCVFEYSETSKFTWHVFTKISVAPSDHIHIKLLSLQLSIYSNHLPCFFGTLFNMTEFIL